MSCVNVFNCWCRELSEGGPVYHRTCRSSESNTLSSKPQQEASLFFGSLGRLFSSSPPYVKWVTSTGRQLCRKTAQWECAERLVPGTETLGWQSPASVSVSLGWSTCMGICTLREDDVFNDPLIHPLWEVRTIKEGLWPHAESHYSSTDRTHPRWWCNGTGCKESVCVQKNPLALEDWRILQVLFPRN